MTSSSSVLSLRANLESVRAIGPWLLDCLALTASPSLLEQAGAIELALHEVAVNVVEHSLKGNGEAFEFRFEWTASTSTATFVCVDGGPAVHTEALPDAPDEPQVGGYGLMIVEQVADSFGYERRDNANIWTVVFVSNDTESE